LVALLVLVLGVRSVSAAPDFMITNKGIELDTLNPQTEETVTITAWIQNIGDDQGNATVKFFNGDSLLGERSIENFTAGSTTNLTFEWVIPADAETGSSDIRVEIVSAGDENHNNDLGQTSTIIYRKFDGDAEDLDVGSGSSYTISTYVHDGHLRITGSGDVTLEDGIFEVNQDHDNQYFIELSSSATLTIKENATLRSNKMLTIYLRGNSELIIDNSSVRARVIARDESDITVKNHASLQGNLDLACASFKLTNATLAGSSARIQVITVSAKDVKMSFETLDLESGSQLEIARSTFDLEDGLRLVAPGSLIVDSSFTRSLVHLTEGFHQLINVATPWISVSGTAELERWWYLTVTVVDMGKNPVPDAEVIHKPTLSGGEVTDQTDAKGIVIIERLANETTVGGDDFKGNYKVKATYNEHTIDFIPIILNGNMELTLTLPELRLNKALLITLQLRADGSPLGNKEIESGEPFTARAIVTYIDGTHAAVKDQTVYLSIDGKTHDSMTDGGGMAEFKLKAPDESKTYTIRVWTSSGGTEYPTTKDLTVEEGSGTLGPATLVVIVLLLLVALVVMGLFIQKVSLSYATDIAQCGGCGQRIPLDSETCPECGEKLDPFEAFDPAEESMVSRDRGV